MTKYVLNSGGGRKQPERARNFFAEIVKGQGAQPRFLFCIFSQPREYWETKFVAFKDFMSGLLPEGVEPIFDLAMPDRFIEQVKASDIIYFHGGDDYLLHYWLKQFSIPEIWAGKVVAGSSAGSSALSRYAWTCDWRKVIDGLNILPIKFLPHYDSSFGSDDPRGPIDWEKGREELEAYGDRSLPVYALREGEYIVIEQ